MKTVSSASDVHDWGIWVEGMPPFYLEFESGRLESGIGYIRFNTFHPDLITDMVNAIVALQDTSGIIIDLRGNPGGEPNTAEQLAAQFLDGWILFGNFKTRSGNMSRPLIGKNVYTGPLVILIDPLSYSASEYFTSGMQTLGRAVIIGERSPGGATAMWVKVLPNDVLLGLSRRPTPHPGWQGGGGLRHRPGY